MKYCLQSTWHRVWEGGDGAPITDVVDEESARRGWNRIAEISLWTEEPAVKQRGAGGSMPPFKPWLHRVLIGLLGKLHKLPSLKRKQCPAQEVP